MKEKAQCYTCQHTDTEGKLETLPQCQDRAYKLAY